MAWCKVIHFGKHTHNTHISYIYIHLWKINIFYMGKSSMAHGFQRDVSLLEGISQNKLDRNVASMTLLYHVCPADTIQLIGGGFMSSRSSLALSTVCPPTKTAQTSDDFGIFGPEKVSCYCGWKKSCTTLDGWNPINNGINHLSTGAGFLPSTVCPVWRA